MFGKISNKSYDFNPFFVTKVQSQGGIKFDEKFIKTVLDQYNQLIDHIVKIDQAKKQNNISRILKVVTSYNRPLSNLGITATRNHNLLLNEQQFLQTALKSPHHLKLLLDSKNGILRKIHDSFKEVMSW